MFEMVAIYVGVNSEQSTEDGLDCVSKTSRERHA